MSTEPWQRSIHTYEPDESGRCTSGWSNDDGKWVQCLSTQRSSVLHDDLEAEFREMHDHGGGDCMCFEMDDGPSYHEAMRRYAHPTDEEIAEEERARERQMRRRRRAKALSRGKAITRLVAKLGTMEQGDPRIAGTIDRLINLNRWGVTQ